MLFCLRLLFSVLNIGAAIASYSAADLNNDETVNVLDLFVVMICQ